VAEPAPPDPDDATAAHRRTVLFTAVGAVLAAALLFAIVARVQSANPDTAGSGQDAAGATAQFDAGNAERGASDIARSGPRLFPDPQGRSRDIFVQHLGGTDWTAFEARAPGAPRQCTLRWEQDARRFVDPCDGRIFPPDGAGLVTFPTRVDDDGRVIVDLSSPRAPGAP
jgi:hypothetical protein